MKMIVALFAVAFAAGIARRLWRLAHDRTPSLLDGLAADAERSTHVVISVTPRVRDEL